MFFQLIVAFSIWTTGIIVHAVQGFPQFYGTNFMIIENYILS